MVNKLAANTNVNKPLFQTEFLERCEAITRKYEQEKKLTPLIQLLKMFEEVGEVQRAIINGDIDNLKEELVDVILSSITMYHKFNIKPLEIQQLLESKLLKVEKRVKVNTTFVVNRLRYTDGQLKGLE